MTVAAIAARYVEDVAPGQILPPLVKHVRLVDMMRYGAATWDFARIHYDAAYARRHGLPGPIADGQMLGAFLAQHVRDWAGPRGFLRKLSFRNRAMVFAGDTVTCHGAVESVREEEGLHLVELRLWIENGRGERVVEPAAATVSLPSRGNGS